MNCPKNKAPLDRQYRFTSEHGSIVKRYSILNECLRLISRSNITPIDKLKIETTLIRIKKLLLNGVPAHKIRCGCCGEDVFEGLLYQMRRICGGVCREDVLADSMERIGGILTVLGGGSIPETSML
jgi:hypothetical protein